MERIVYNELYEYCTENNLLTWRNSGFKAMDSTVNQLINIVHKIYSTLADNNDVLMIFLDVAKAFDKVYHRGLLHKLEALGVSNNLLKWFESYLLGRYQRVVISGRTSEWREITAGVSQGSILGPLLFLIFINDIVDDLGCDPFLYADDTSLFHVLNDDTNDDVITRDLDMIHAWAAQWRVTFTASKTVYMIFSKKLARPAPRNILFGGTQVQQVHTHCHLGLHFNDFMGWENHVNAICLRASKSVNLLKRMRRQVDRKTKLFIYRLFIRPKLEYANIVYGSNLSHGQGEAIEKVQRQALLACTYAYRHTSHSQLLHETAIESLSTRRKYFRLCQLYKMINGLCPAYLTRLLPPFVHDIANYSLRNSHNIHKPKTRKGYLANSFLWTAIDDWNRLDFQIRSSTSVYTFKLSMKDKLFYKRISWFDFGIGNGAINHARIRMGLSGLNAHRKKYNFIPNSACPMCGIKPENEVHYFIKCPHYAIQRAAIMGTISTLIDENQILNINILPRNKPETDALISLLLRGSPHLSFEANIGLARAVQIFIKETKRLL